ncbi:hypothetical protein WN55_00856, partial [Dufourea novaeangliae]
THPLAVLVSDRSEVRERLEDDIVKFGIVPCQRSSVQFFRAAQCLVVLLLGLQKLLGGSVLAIACTLTTNRIVLPGGVLDQQNLPVQQSHVCGWIDLGPGAGEQQSRPADPILQQHRRDHGRNGSRRRSRQLETQWIADKYSEERGR